MLRFLARMKKSKSSYLSLPDPRQSALHPGPEISTLLLRLSVSITEYITIYTNSFGPNNETETVPPKPDHRLMCQHLHLSNHVHTKITSDEPFSYQMSCVAELTDLFQTTAIASRGISLQLALGGQHRPACHAGTS